MLPGAPLHALLLEHGWRPFQMDFAGSAREIMALDDPLDFGTGTRFVRDPDRNLVEFLQTGRGFLTEDTRPRVPKGEG